ncbi:MAG: hypothetical protein GX811_13185, partial [Lentisphaerae bacterium]|nr:hypothetical protein [Lentisphaerota bacterium]
MTNDLTVASGGLLTHSSNTVVELNKQKLNLSGSLTIESEGKIDVTGKGHSVRQGPGIGVQYYGGGYGGRGGAIHAGSEEGICYGSLVDPQHLGTGGYSAPGGGAIILEISGTFQNNGVVCADGGSAVNYAGSGGSINIRAGKFIGTGDFSANGGKVTNGGPGGGGRIALTIMDNGNDFSNIGPVFAKRSEVGSGGSAGTIYLRLPGQNINEGKLIIDNNGKEGSGTTINEFVTDTSVGDVELINSACLFLEEDQVLEVSGIWSNSASFIAEPNSAIIFNNNRGTDSIIYGSTSFMGLICTNAGKNIYFEANLIQTIKEYGRLILNGTPGEPVTLYSSREHTAWALAIDPLAEQAVSHCRIQDSIASDAEGTAINSEDKGRNVNWRFLTVIPGETNTWTGAVSSFWSDRDNWSLDRAPNEDNFVLIPSGCPHNPELDAPRSIGGILIEQGADLALNSHNLIVTRDASIRGLLKADNFETITFTTNACFAGGTFIPALSTIKLSGTQDREFNGADLTFYKLEIEDSTAPLLFTGGFTATEFRCTEEVENVAMYFGAGITIYTRDFIMLGSDTMPNISLHGKESGSNWNLVATGLRWVRGANVRDSNASDGMSILAALSTDSGNSRRWNFDS